MTNLPYLNTTPQWASYSHPTGSNLAKLVFSLGVNPGETMFIDTLPSLFGRTDHKVTYTVVSTATRPSTVTLGGVTIKETDSKLSALSSVLPKWYYNNNTLYISHPNRVTTLWTSTDPLPSKLENTRVFIQTSTLGFSALDLDLGIQLPVDDYQLIYSSTTLPTLVIDGVNTPYNLNTLHNPWTIQANYNHIHLSNYTQIQGALQTDVLFKRPEVKLSAKLFSPSLKWWAGDASISDSTKNYDVVKEQFVTYTDVYHNVDRFTLTLEDGVVNIKADGIDIKSYQQIGNTIILTQKYNEVVVKLSRKLYSYSNGLYLSSKLPPTLYPLVQTEVVTINTVACYKHVPKWGKSVTIPSIKNRNLY